MSTVRTSKVTIYAREVDDEVWEWARRKATEDRLSLARVVADALRAYRAAASREETGTAR